MVCCWEIISFHPFGMLNGLRYKNTHEPYQQTQAISIKSVIHHLVAIGNATLHLTVLTVTNICFHLLKQEYLEHLLRTTFSSGLIYIWVFMGVGPVKINYNAVVMKEYVTQFISVAPCCVSLIMFGQLWSSMAQKNIIFIR